MSHAVSPTVLEVADVQGAVRFLHEGLGLRVIAECSDGADSTYKFVEDEAQAVRVIVLPRAKEPDSSGTAFFATLTLPTPSVRSTASNAIRAGAHLVTSQRVRLPGERLEQLRNNTPADPRVPPASRSQRSQGTSSVGDGETLLEEPGTRMAWLESHSTGVRVLLMDERLLGRAPRSSEPPLASRNSAQSIESASIGSRSSYDRSASESQVFIAEGGALARRAHDRSDASDASVVGDMDSRGVLPTGYPSASSLLSGVVAMAIRAQSEKQASMTNTRVEGRKSGRSDELQCTSVSRSDCTGGDSGGRSELARISNGSPGGHLFAASDSDGAGSEEELAEVMRAPSVGAAGQERSGAGGAKVGRRLTDADAAGNRGAPVRGGSWPDLSQSFGIEAKAVAVRQDVWTADPEERINDQDSTSRGALDAEVVADRSAQTNEGAIEAGKRMTDKDFAGRKPPWATAERPFRMLEVIMKGNRSGPLVVTPNSMAPVPIRNDYFEGQALFMMKREPMDKAYAHMFEGKNRMFEVQVQGRFKKPPAGELYISLEITEMMKIGLLAKGLCKLLLSFGQRMNSALHYSFGDKNDKELPHISFPLLSSVDSLIVTPEGEEPPVLGMPFEESKESKARRKRGEGYASDATDFKTDCTYNFSFHSMYIDMVQWSTCKIPIMRDVDLHTFWGNSVLRITAYVINRPPSAVTGKAGGAGAKTLQSFPHLQSELNYVFCLQVRHLTQAERDRPSEMDGTATLASQDAEAEGIEEEAGRPGDEYSLPLLTDRSPSPRGRQRSASRWTSNDEESADERERRAARRRRRQAAAENASGQPDAASAEANRDGGVNISGDEDFDSGDDTSSETTGTSSDRTDSLLSGKSRNERGAEGPKDGSGDLPKASSATSMAGLDSASVTESTDSDYYSLSSTASLSQATSVDKRSSPKSRSVKSQLFPTAKKGVRRLARSVNPLRNSSFGYDHLQGRDDEDYMVRCPAYVDLYAGKAKLKGTWTVFCVVKRGADGGFALRSSKNLSILPSSMGPPSSDFSQRLSRREIKRRKFDTLLQLLTAPSHAHINSSHQIHVRAVLGVESSADRAFRSWPPAPPSVKARRSHDASASGGQNMSNISEVQAVQEVQTHQGEQRDTNASMALEWSSTLSSSHSEGSVNDGGGRTAGGARRPSKVWASRSSSTVKEGMVLRVLSEHHLSQQMALLLPSSLTFSRPRKQQCLRLLTRDIIGVEIGGLQDSEAGDTSNQLIPGMFPVEVHTMGRVHYMLVEGFDEARSWAAAIRTLAGHEGKASPQDEVSISDPFSQYMTKKSTWRANNFWVLNCRRAELSANIVEGSWGSGCWFDRGDIGGEICDFVAALLKQALDLNEDSKTEQLIIFLDNACKLRWMPLGGLSQAEQLSVFLNLYHVMLLHSYFLLGPPGSPLRVASYFTTLCYEVGGEVLSLAELEHCVIRAKSSTPKQFLSKLIIPQTEYPFALRSPEPRVSFALNCGSVSGVPGIVMYRPETVDDQLEDASMYYVHRTTEVYPSKRTVILPKIISWYSDDFAEADSSNSSLSSLLRVKQYIVGENRRQVEALLADGGNINIKFDTWNWKCRPVTLVDEIELARLRSCRI